MQQKKQMGHLNVPKYGRYANFLMCLLKYYFIANEVRNNEHRRTNGHINRLDDIVADRADMHML